MRPINPKGLYQGWKRTSVYLLLIHSTSPYTASLFSQTTTESISTFSERKPRKRITHVLEPIIFSGHSTREPASSRMTYFMRAYTSTGVSHSQHRKKKKKQPRERFWKNAGEWTLRVEISKEEILGDRRSMHGYIRTCFRLKRENLWAIDGLMPFSDLKPLTAKCLHQVWQKEWDEAIIVSNKLHGILPKLSDKLLTFCNTRKEDTVLNRLHIGHSYFTHSFLLKKEEASVYVACNTTITVKHSLIECADLVEVRKKYFEENLCIHCSEMWIRRAFLTTWKILVCFIKYKVF